MYGILILLHILGAAVWTGGHLILAFTILPRVLRERSPADLLRFESAYERIGLPALIIQIITGLVLAHRLVPDPARWFNPEDMVGRLVGVKLLLLATTVAFALDARLRVIPNLNEGRLVSMAWHIIPVTLIAVLFVVVGVSFRTGWFY